MATKSASPRHVLCSGSDRRIELQLRHSRRRAIRPRTHVLLPVDFAGIAQSDDYGATFSSTVGVSTGKTLPTGVTAGNIASIVKFNGYVYVYGTDGTSFGAWRTPIVNQTADFGTWSEKLFTMPAGTAALLTPSGWQAVQISFDKDYVWFARDSLRA